MELTNIIVSGIVAGVVSIITTLISKKCERIRKKSLAMKEEQYLQDTVREEKSKLYTSTDIDNYALINYEKHLNKLENITKHNCDHIDRGLFSEIINLIHEAKNNVSKQKDDIVFLAESHRDDFEDFLKRFEKIFENNENNKSK